MRNPFALYEYEPTIPREARNLDELLAMVEENGEPHERDGRTVTLPRLKLRFCYDKLGRYMWMQRLK